MEIKKINRNAFNEKLIHRYLFERYYFSESSIKKNYYLINIIKKTINLISPEEGKENNGYRADLTIYFKDEDKGVPVEVKWSSENFTKNNQVDYIKNNNGFVVCFDFQGEKNGIDYIKIDYNDFIKWITGNISKLTRESLSYQAKNKEIVNNQCWVVILRGTSHDNFRKMLKTSSNSPFWAFKQNDKALKNILDMQKGDRCLFLLGVAKEGMGMSDNPNLNFEYVSWYSTVIKEPYYMVLKGDKGTFFESGNIPINHRRWPHFIDFEIDDKQESENRINFGKRGEYSKAFADSVNYGAGAPAPLLTRQFETLLDKLRFLRK